MASATARPIFSFHLRTSKPKTHFHFPLPRPSPSLSLQIPSSFSLKSIEVSKEDKPLSDKPDSSSLLSDPEPEPEPQPQPQEEEEEKFDKRRLEEKFAVLNTGIHECRSCGYRYDVAVGDPSYPIPPGLDFGKLPQDWRCPTCGAAQSFFISKRLEVAGFEQNQQFGLGGNALTAGQKAILIYGSLLLLFVLFLSGYFLQ